MSDLALPGLWLPQRPRIAVPRLRLPKWTRPAARGIEVTEAVSFVAAATGNGTATSLTAAYPTGWANGDYLPCLLFNSDPNGTLGALPTGWSLVAGPIQPSNQVDGWLVEKIAETADDTTPTFTWTGAAGSGTGFIMGAYRDADSTTPRHKSNSVANAANGATVDVPLTGGNAPTIDGCVIAGFFFVDATSDLDFTSSLANERSDIGTFPSTMNAALFDETQATAAGITVTGTFSSASFALGGFALAIAPAAAGGATSRFLGILGAGR